jgi:hypothetical protein
MPCSNILNIIGVNEANEAHNLMEDIHVHGMLKAVYDAKGGYTK